MTNINIFKRPSAEVVLKSMDEWSVTESDLNDENELYGIPEVIKRNEFIFEIIRKRIDFIEDEEYMSFGVRGHLSSKLEVK